MRKYEGVPSRDELFTSTLTGRCLCSRSTESSLAREQGWRSRHFSFLRDTANPEPIKQRHRCAAETSTGDSDSSEKTEQARLCELPWMPGSSSRGLKPPAHLQSKIQRFLHKLALKFIWRQSLTPRRYARPHAVVRGATPVCEAVPAHMPEVTARVQALPQSSTTRWA